MGFYDVTPLPEDQHLAAVELLAQAAQLHAKTRIRPLAKWADEKACLQALIAIRLEQALGKGE